MIRPDPEKIVRSARKILELEAAALNTVAKRMGVEIFNAVDLILKSQGRLVVSGMPLPGTG